MSAPNQTQRSTIDRIKAKPASRRAQSPGRKTTGFTPAQIEAVRDTALALTASLDFDQVLSNIAKRLVDLIAAQASIVYLIEPSNDTLKIVAGHNIPSSLIGLTLDKGEDLAGRAVLSGRSTIVDNYSAWTERAGVFERAAPDSIFSQAVSAAVVPLTYGSSVLGVLEVVGSEQRLISDKDVALLQLLAPYASAAIAHTQLFDRNQQIMTLLETINDRAAAVSSVGQAVITAGHDLRKMSAEVLMRTIASLRLAGGKIFLVDPITHQLLATASETLLVYDDGPGLKRVAAHCLSVGQTILLQNMTAQTWTREIVNWLADQGLGSMVCVPLIADNEVVGVLEVVTKTNRTFSTGELDTLHIIAGQLALGVANAGLFTRVRAEQQQLAAILSSSGDVVIGLDTSGHIQLANPAAERAFGFAARHAIGRSLHEVTLNVALNTAVTNAIAGDKVQPVGFEVPLAEDAILFCNLSPIVDPAGNLTGWVAVMQDITRFKETERLKSDMILTASHDLRNPVNLTLSALDLLGKNTGNWTATQREAYDLALLGAQRIEALISDLLDLERIERRVGLNLAQCVLAEIAQSVVTELSLQAQDRQLELQLTVLADNDLTRVRGDTQRLYQVMSNLLGNAIKYTEAGGEIQVTIWARDDQVRLDVKDTGPGIPQEAQARLFERFYRVPNMSTDIHSTGLGLAIVKSIIDQHGGRVWVTSIAGQGSTFSISLPMWQEDMVEHPTVPLDVDGSQPENA
jgi:PAS domain S-box-containing protein